MIVASTVLVLADTVEWQIGAPAEQAGGDRDDLPSATRPRVTTPVITPIDAPLPRADVGLANAASESHHAAAPPAMTPIAASPTPADQVVDHAASESRREVALIVELPGRATSAQITINGIKARTGEIRQLTTDRSGRASAVIEVRARGFRRYRERLQLTEDTFHVPALRKRRSSRRGGPSGGKPSALCCSDL